MYKSNLPDWYRIAGLQPDAEAMPKRIAAIEKYGADANSLILLARLFYGIGEPNADFLSAWRLAIQQEDTLFSNRGNEVELAVLAGAKLIEIMYSSSTLSEMASLAVACTSCQKLRTNPSVPEIPELAIKCLSQQTAERSSVYAARKNSELSSILAESAVPALIQEIANMQAELRLVTEESNILWWLFAEHSREENVHWNQLEFPAVLLMIGKELADLTVVLPGPAATLAFLDKVARIAKNKLPESVILKTAINGLSVDWRKKYFTQSMTQELESLMPITHGIRLSLLTPQVDGWCPGFTDSTGIPFESSLAPQKLSFQIYLECLLYRAWKQIN
jgi:hypothetical protein